MDNRKWYSVFILFLVTTFIIYSEFTIFQIKLKVEKEQEKSSFFSQDITIKNLSFSIKTKLLGKGDKLKTKQF